MELRNLQYFIFVYEELNFSKAAQKCFVSQPSISSAVMQLEKELGRQLFIRHAKGVSPTKAGEEFYPAALKIMNQIRDMQAMFASAGPQMELRLALMPYLSGQLVGLMIKELIGSMPELNLSVVGWNDEADARIISQSMVLQNEVFHKLWRDKYVLVLPPEHPLARQERITLKDLNGASFVSRTFCDARDTWNYALRKHGVNLVSKATVDTEEYALDLVAAGLGVSLVPSHSAKQRPDLIRRPISDVQLERVVGLAYQNNRPIPERLLNAVQAAKRRIMEQTEPDPGPGGEKDAA